MPKKKKHDHQCVLCGTGFNWDLDNECVENTTRVELATPTGLGPITKVVAYVCSCGGVVALECNAKHPQHPKEDQFPPNYVYGLANHEI